MPTVNEHIPVLLNEAIEGLDIKENGVYVDLTLGRGGHSSVILSHLKNGKLYCFDKDESALEFSRDRLSKISPNFEIIRSDFRYFDIELKHRGVDKVDGILIDLGVSSPQFDDPTRGFSYKSDARLDMRMDTRQSLSAYEVVNTYSLQDLTRIFREYGEEKFAYQIARKIISKREKGEKIETTFELVDVIKSVLPQKELAKKGHPAKQVFQALRIEVNDELGALKEVLDKALDFLNVHGRLVVISFHSLEDRMVKKAFQERAIIQGSRHDVYRLPTKDDEPDFNIVSHKVITAGEQELEINPRAKSAKMRVIERREK